MNWVNVCKMKRLHTLSFSLTFHCKKWTVPPKSPLWLPPVPLYALWSVIMCTQSEESLEFILYTKTTKFTAVLLIANQWFRKIFNSLRHWPPGSRRSEEVRMCKFEISKEFMHLFGHYSNRQHPPSIYWLFQQPARAMCITEVSKMSVNK